MIEHIEEEKKQSEEEDTRIVIEEEKPTHPALCGSLVPPETYNGPVMNFCPGPTSLPTAVESEIQKRCFARLQETSDEHVDENGKPTQRRPRLSTIALSHRSLEFGHILKESVEAVRRVMEIPDEYEVLFCHGGGHGQFAAVPLNLCSSRNDKATYIVNGTWGVRAVAEAKKYCTPIAISSRNETDGSFDSVPNIDNIDIDPESKFVYVCSNETVNGIEHHDLPKLLGAAASKNNVPLVVDASSDFSSKPIDWRGSNVGVLFACASKNIGHPGVTIVVVRKDLLGTANPFCPGVLDYTTTAATGNLWNTIATFNVHVVGIVMEWIAKEGGIYEMERRAIAKSQRMYDVIDKSGGFYSCPINDPNLRSRMNVPFDVVGGDKTLTEFFLIEAWELGIVGLRTLTPFGVGQYLRASFYHGVNEEYATILTDFMISFAEKNSNAALSL